MDTPRTDALKGVAMTRHDSDEFARSLERELRRATMGRCQCSDCKKEVLNAWRDSDGHHCLTCIAKDRDDLREELKATLDYLIAWRADASKCQNQTLVIDRLQKLLGITER